jgi:hypothetical protein
VCVDNIIMNNKIILYGAWSGFIWLRTGTGEGLTSTVTILQVPQNGETNFG